MALGCIVYHFEAKFVCDLIDRPRMISCFKNGSVGCKTVLTFRNTLKLKENGKKNNFDLTLEAPQGFQRKQDPVLFIYKVSVSINAYCIMLKTNTNLKNEDPKSLLILVLADAFLVIGMLLI